MNDKRGKGRGEMRSEARLPDIKERAAPWAMSAREAPGALDGHQQIARGRARLGLDGEHHKEGEPGNCVGLRVAEIHDMP